MKEESKRKYHLIAEGINKSYIVRNKKINILNGIDLKIAKKEKVFLHGPSGAGKTTLLYSLAGLEKPDKGNILLNGISLYNLSNSSSAKIRNEKMGFIFQSYHLFPDLTALENILLPSLLGDGKSIDYATFLLNEVGLYNRKEHLANELSGGEQQRVALARALINHPEIIFADEPTGNLDTKNGHLLMDILVKLTSELNRTLLLVTHDMNLTSYSDRQLTIIDGKIS